MSVPNAALGDIFVTVHRAQNGSQAGEFTCGWYVGAITGAAGPYTDIITDIDTIFESQFQSAWSDSIALMPSKLYVLDPATGLASQGAEATNGITHGTSTIGTIPGQVALVIKKNTGKLGRSMRGRCFHPFINKNWVLFSGEFDPSVVASTVNRYNTLFVQGTTTSTGGTTTYAPCIIHRKPLPLRIDPITLFSSDGLLGTQKRRGDFGRANLI